MAGIGWFLSLCAVFTGHKRRVFLTSWDLKLGHRLTIRAPGYGRPLLPEFKSGEGSRVEGGNISLHDFCSTLNNQLHCYTMQIRMVWGVALTGTPPLADTLKTHKTHKFRAKPVTARLPGCAQKNKTHKNTQNRAAAYSPVCVFCVFFV